MKATFLLTSPHVADRAIEAIRAIATDGSHEVVVRPYSKNRSASQSALMWVWLTVIAGELGETKDCIHERMKKKHLVRIYERDDPSGYGEMVSAIRAVHRHGMKVEAAAMAAQIVKLTSTTVATVKQMTEYLQDIEKEAISLGIILPHPDDLFYEAMGITR